MLKFINALYFGAKSLHSNALDFVVDEAKRIKQDESGMELLQLILIIVIVVIIAAVLWAFLGDWIQDMLNTIFQQSQDFDAIDIENPRV